MTSNNAAQAAKILLERRINNKKAGCLSDLIRPKSIDDSLAIQQELITQLDDTIAGWKCLLPPSDDTVVVAPIFQKTIQRGDHCCLFAENNKARVEPEIAFILANDLPANEKGYSDDEIDQAISHCHMALELMQTRFENCQPSFYEKLADCLVNQGLFIGPKIDKKAAYQASTIKISITQDNKTTHYDGKHPNETPNLPVYWLINYMTKRGISFTKGQAIITGSFAGIIDVDFNTLCDIEYQNLGNYSVTFKAK